MVDITRATRINNGISLSESLAEGDVVGIFHGSQNPSLPGEAAPIGSIFLRTDGTLFQKNGLADTDWAVVGGNTPFDMAGATYTTPATLLLNPTFQLPTWDTTHESNDVFAKDIINQQEIEIKQAGLFLVTYSLTINSTTGETQFNARLRHNGVVVPGSGKQISEDNEIAMMSNSFVVQLPIGTVDLQVNSAANGDVLTTASTLSFVHLKTAKGEKGDTGTPGAGSSIIVQENFIAIPNTPHSTLNFREMSVIDQFGIATIRPIFGSEYHYSESLNISTVLSTVYQTKITQNVNISQAGTYRLGYSYSWNADSTSRDFMARIRQDGAIDLFQHRQEPKDSAGSFATTFSDQRHTAGGFINLNLSAGTHTFRLQWRGSIGSIESSIWDARLEFWRVQ